MNIFHAMPNDSVKVKKAYELLKSRDNPLSAQYRLTIAKEAVRIADSLHLKKGLAVSLMLIGELNLNSDNPNPYEGIETAFKALEIFEELNDDNGKARAFQLLGWFYEVADNHEQGLTYSLKALEYAEKLKDQKLKASVYNNLGVIYHSLNDMQKCVKCYKLAIVLTEAEKNYPRLARAYGNLSEAYIEMNEPKLALENRLKAIQLFREMNSRGGVMWHYSGLAEVLAMQKKYAEAEKYLDTVLDHMREHPWTELQREAYRVAELLYKNSGKIDRAYYYKTAYHRLRDSSDKVNDVSKVAELKLFYEQQKTEKLREMQDKMKKEKHESEIKQQRLILTAVIIILALISLLGFRTYRSLKTEKKQKLEIEEKSRLVEEKQKEILDSIEYAKRIQLAQIPNEKFIETVLRRLRKG